MIKTATVIIDDDRFDNVVVSWIIGTNNLQLCHKGEYVLGSSGQGMEWQPATVIRTVPVKGGITHDNVEEEATKLFDSVGEMFVNEHEYAESDEWRD